MEPGRIPQSQAELALSSPTWSVAQAAIDALDDPVLLEEVAHQLEATRDQTRVDPISGQAWQVASLFPALCKRLGHAPEVDCACRRCGSEHHAWWWSGKEDGEMCQRCGAMARYETYEWTENCQRCGGTGRIEEQSSQLSGQGGWSSSESCPDCTPATRTQTRRRTTRRIIYTDGTERVPYWPGRFRPSHPAA
ncbi:MAG: hypothetical protein LBR27_00270 [Bifidobacteriaceae bacterium]|jgi:hypothetical protein|nr:hypothetical protein [Bifidobacteriaceae bacterium]